MIEILIGLAIFIAIMLIGRVIVTVIDAIKGRSTPVDNIGDWAACWAVGFVGTLMTILFYLLGRIVKGCS